LLTPPSGRSRRLIFFRRQPEIGANCSRFSEPRRIIHRRTIGQRDQGADARRAHQSAAILSARAIFSISRWSLVNSFHKAVRAVSIAPITVSKMACSGYQLPNAGFEPPPADFADLQPVTTQYATDAEFDIEKLALQELSAGEKGARILARRRFRVNRAIPSHSQQLGDPAGILPIRHRGERALLHAASTAARIASGCDNPGMQPLR